MDNRLLVYLENELVGSLARTRNGARFEYDDAIVEMHLGEPLLSTSLPVQPEPFDAARTASWFSGLLPEDTRLEEIRRFYGIQGEGYLDVLQEVGWECAGAVSVISANGVRPHVDSGVEPISPQELADRLSALPSHPYDTADTLRISLGGFQEKLCVVAPNAILDGGIAHMGSIGIPIGGSPTTHILKPQPHRFAGLIRAEAWGMSVASQVTPTSRTALLDAGVTNAPETLVVERFDRDFADGTVRRIHQEDCCQALGIPPERKYAAESSPKKSDPSFKKIAALLSRYSANPGIDLSTLAHQLVTNIALGNTDAHGKNYSLLHRNGGVTLAPLYDVIPALEITPGTILMGMRVAGRIRIDRIGHNELVEEVASWGIPSRQAERLVNDDLERIREGVRYADTLYPRAAERHSPPALERLAHLAKRN